MKILDFSFCQSLNLTSAILSTLLSAPLVASEFTSWLGTLPDGYLNYVYEVGATRSDCSQEFCAAAYGSGRTPKLSCRQVSGNSTLRFTLLGKKNSLRIKLVSKLNEELLTTSINGDGVWQASKSSSNIYDLNYSGTVNGETVKNVHFSASTYRHDPYLGWFADRTYTCRGLEGAFISELSSVKVSSQVQHLEIETGGEISELGL